MYWNLLKQTMWLWRVGGNKVGVKKDLKLERERGSKIVVVHWHIFSFLSIRKKFGKTSLIESIYSRLANAKFYSYIQSIYWQIKGGLVYVQVMTNQIHCFLLPNFFSFFSFFFFYLYSFIFLMANGHESASALDFELQCLLDDLN